MFTVVTPFKAMKVEPWSDRYRFAALHAHDEVRAVVVDSPGRYVIRLVVKARTADGVPSAEVLRAVGAAALAVAEVGYQIEVMPHNGQ